MSDMNRRSFLKLAGAAVIASTVAGKIAKSLLDSVPSRPDFSVKHIISDGSVQPAGSMTMTVAEPPDGWLLCDGRSLDRTQYANLFSTIGVSYGYEEPSWYRKLIGGKPKFKVPDMRGKLIRRS